MRYRQKCMHPLINVVSIVEANPQQAKPATAGPTNLDGSSEAGGALPGPKIFNNDRPTR